MSEKMSKPIGGAPRARGAPPKLTAIVHAQIIAALKVGAYLKHAAAAAGIGQSTVHEWLKRGEAGEEPYASFAADVERVRAEEVVASAKVVANAAEAGDWRAAAWLLERKHPKSFGARREEDDDGKPGATLHSIDGGKAREELVKRKVGSTGASEPLGTRAESLIAEDESMAQCRPQTASTTRS